MTKVGFFFLLMTLGSLVGRVQLACGEQAVDFNRDIRPLLSDRCFHCHGPDAKSREGGFRLDQQESVFGETESGERPIVPQHPEQSELIRRVTTENESERMPPEESTKKPLSADEVALLRRWVQQGAPWQQHWSLVPPEQADVPAVKNAAWPRNAIDSFVLSRLEAEGLKPSPEASREHLIRRVTLDLTGLPPTLKEVDAFLADQSPQAYEHLVDRLLASPHYGQRMAWPWLDAARYADTDGYQGDPTRTMWPWRDWVVDAINHDMPFDQFTIEQLAGDLLPGATAEQIVATGFHRNHMYNGEGGRIAEETRVENVFDRTETTATVWMGLTFTCTRCHNHKYDPLTQKDYFALYDFFNQTSESGGGGTKGHAAPSIAYVPSDLQSRLDDLNQKIAAAQRKLSKPDPQTDAAQAVWEGQWSNAWSVLDATQLEASSGATLEKLDDQSIRATGPITDRDTYRIVAHTPLTNLSAIRLEALVDQQASPTGSNGRASNGNAVLSEIEATIRPLGDADAPPQPLRFTSATADHSQPGLPATLAIDGKRGGRAGWATEGYSRKENRTAMFYTDQPFGFENGTEIEIHLHCDTQHVAHVLARVRLAVSSKPRQDKIDDQIARIIALPGSERNQQQIDLLRDYYRRNHSDQHRQIADQITAWETSQQKLRDAYKGVSVMVMDTIGKPRTTRMLKKGLYDKPIGEPVTADVPESLPVLPAESHRDRLALARWLVSPDHPLTARVTVNRQWELFFGRGLVKTPDDFGMQGARPSHPELLDWLAVHFVNSGWDVKALHKLIVMSATYRQSSSVSDKLFERDPDNVLLARGARFRLPSWMLRDQALAAAGLLVPQLGGPPVRPYQPPDIWAEATFGKIRYQPDTGENLYRRSLYVFWRRIVGPTMFFDVANRQTCSVKTSRTNSPLHALTTLNDVTYVEAARALAERAIMAHNGVEPRLTFIFRTLTARTPETDELQILTSRLESLHGSFANQPDEARRLLAVGDSPSSESLDPVEHASYAALCNMLLNLDEVLNKP